ncbi:MAG: cytochrome-c oxidase, cbb3-type subunit III, partial [Proteobacteria bacterium]|nr:cytochrome-c oxidase, cbb3-type subunit III [Pseudomonadota bacterium]
RVLFYITLFFSLFYWILYPSSPSPNSNGLLTWSSYKELEEDQRDIEKLKEKYQAEFDNASFKEIMDNPALMKFAIAGGRFAFHNNCAPCHGSGGTGSIGYPNLASGSWMWGGTIDDIYQTIKYGIRSGHEDTRESAMAAFGDDKILNDNEVKLLTQYVISLSAKSNALDNQASLLFKEHCASCHGIRGEGMRDFGAPSLQDAIWLYGDDEDSIYKTIYHGRAGIMPYWEGKLKDSLIKQVAIYVHQLGGGE